MMGDDRVADMSMLKCYVPPHFHQLFRRDDGNKPLLLIHSYFSLYCSLDIHIVHTVPKRSTTIDAMRLGPELKTERPSASVATR